MIELSFQDSSFLGIIGKMELLYWSADCITRFLGYEKSFLLENSDCVATVVEEDRLKNFNPKFTTRNVMLHQKFVELLKESTLKSAQSLYELFSRDCFYVTETNTDFFSFIKVCSQDTPHSKNFYLWLESYKTELFLYGPNYVYSPPSYVPVTANTYSPCSPSYIPSEPSPEEPPAEPPLVADPYDSPDSPPYVSVEPPLVVDLDYSPNSPPYVSVEPPLVIDLDDSIDSSPYVTVERPPVEFMHSPPTSPERSLSPYSPSLPSYEPIEQPAAMGKKKKWMLCFDEFPPTRISMFVNGEKLDYSSKFS